MKILRTCEELQTYSEMLKKQHKSIGLVPTMGALHEGHLTLMRKAKEKCDAVIASVFVNPVQFGPNEDYDAYPRQFDEDCEKLEAVDVDAVFHPEPEEMYPEGYCTYVDVTGDLTNKLCGARRPGHFRGVATVLTKLFNMSRADEAFFGQKDAQQVAVIKRFVKDLALPVRINMVPIVRQEDGLARSSRNAYLSAEEKKKAVILAQSLQEAAAAFKAGEQNVKKLLALVEGKLKTEPLAKIDYVQLYSFPELKEKDVVDEPCLLAIAVYLGKTRLIDNLILGAAD